MAPADEEKLRLLLVSNRLPAVALVSRSSHRTDATRHMQYEMAVQRLDDIPIIQATTIAGGSTKALNNLLRFREDSFSLTMQFGANELASEVVKVRLKLNSGETIQYRFDISSRWNGPATSERIGLDLIVGGELVESLED